MHNPCSRRCARTHAADKEAAASLASASLAPEQLQRIERIRRCAAAVSQAVAIRKRVRLGSPGRNVVGTSGILTPALARRRPERSMTERRECADESCEEEVGECRG
jgi:hypothetical protein